MTIFRDTFQASKETLERLCGEIEGVAARLAPEEQDALWEVCAPHLDEASRQLRFALDDYRQRMD